MKIGGLILMGGKNSRMGGYTKGLLRIQNMTFLEKIVAVFDRFPNVYLSINSKFTKDSKNKYEKMNLILVEDIYEGIGPLDGIYSAFKKCEEDYLMVTACDMPLITKEYVDKLCSYLNEDVDVVVCYDENDRLYPLGAVYSKRVLPIAEDMIQNKHNKLRELIDRSRSIKLSIEKLGFDSKILSNINTPLDYSDLLLDDTTA